jgi:uncharacterized protein with gpF-like domain
MARYLINQSRRREIAQQLALQERLVARFQRLVASNLKGTMQQAVAAFVRDGSDIALEGVVGSRQAGLEAILATSWRVTAKTFGDRVLETVTKGRTFERKDATSDYFEGAIRGYISTWAADAAKDISQTTVKQLRNLILAGVDEGLGIDAIGRSIRDRIPFMSALRANTIARTETHTAANFGAQMAAEATELPLRKEWIATNDDRTREEGWDHVSADGTIVGLHQKFEITNNETGETEELDFPGDPSGSAGNIINCRCVCAYLEAE